MGTYPPLEARVSALERQQTILNARIEEVIENMTTDIKHLSDEVRRLSKDVKFISDDIKASFTQMVQYDMRVEGQIEARFNKIEATMATKDDIANMATKEDLEVVAADIRATMVTKEDLEVVAADIRATMVTRDDLAAMENRILDTLKQMLATINIQRPPSE